VQSNASNNIAKPVVREPKTGSTPFYKGYTDGYSGNDYDSGALWTKTDLDNYEQGYEKGQMHSEDGYDPHYQYVSTPAGWTRHSDGKVSPPPGTTFNAQSGAWPNPKTGPVGY
jgi:hypothetical protein